MSQGREIRGGEGAGVGFGRMTLALQYLLTNTLLLLVGMGLVGYWATARLEAGITRNAASNMANLIDSKLSTLALELARSETLSQGSIRALEELNIINDFSKNVAAFKLWRRDGVILFSNDDALVNQQSAVEGRLADAMSGKVVYDYGGAVESDVSGAPLMELYSPIRLPWSGEVVGVAQYDIRLDDLEENLAQTRLESWLVVGALTLTMISLHYGVVLRSSRKIESQKTILSEKVVELEETIEEKKRLQERLGRATARAQEVNEQAMRRISAELHDGPTQLLAYASLRLDRLVTHPEDKSARADLPRVRDSISSAIRQIRLICRGLAQPELAKAAPLKVLRLATAEHERNTDSQVTLDLPDSLPPISLAAKICIFRFAQETLNNAYRHGGGVDQRLRCRVEGDQIVVVVSDNGPGFSPSSVGECEGLGLKGLRERVVSLGGRFEIDSAPGDGARLSMWLDVNATE